MKFSIMTLFPEMMEHIFSESIIGRARERGILEIEVVNIRDYSLDKHHRVDDTPYGGGFGMLMAAPPIFDCHKAICGEKKIHTIYMSPQGKHLTQKRAEELSKLEHIVILCGHYEGIDQRVLDEIVDEEMSVGDYVLTGGELPAAILVDSVSRLIDGVLPDPECYEKDSISSGLLEYPQYTRPYEFHGEKVPDVLISGHHEKIDEWRLYQSLKKTYLRRPDLIDPEKLDKKGKKLFKQIKEETEK